MLKNICLIILIFITISIFAFTQTELENLRNDSKEKSSTRNLYGEEIH